MDTKKFEQFVWEEELKVLGIEYFFIGKHFNSKTVIFYKILTFLFAALIFLGIGTAISMVAFICEIVCAKISSKISSD